MSLLFDALVPTMKTLWSFGVGIRCPLVYIFKLFVLNFGNFVPSWLVLKLFSLGCQLIYI